MPDLKLFDSDKQVLLDPVGWLTDSLIDAAQTLLKRQFPGSYGLQRVSLGQIMAFTIQHGPFVQVLHSPLGNHWIAIERTEHNEVKVYDSLYPSITSMLKAQIACLLCTQQGEIPLSQMDVTRQVGEMFVELCAWL